MFQKVTKKALVVVMFLSLVLGILVIPSFGGIEAQAATVKLNKTKATIYAGDTVQLTLKNAKSVTWKTSNKKVATVTTKGKVKGIKAGSAKITATNKKTKKSYTCKLTVKAVKSFGLSKSDISLFSTGGRSIMYKGDEIKGATYVLDGKTLTSAEVWVQDGYTHVDLFGTSDGQLSEGDHTFSIKKTGYKTITVTLTYEALKVEGMFARDPQVSAGTLYIFGNPDLLGKTLTIKVDGTVVTPLKATTLNGDGFLFVMIDVSGLSTGSHTVSVAAEGFSEETATFEYEMSIFSYDPVVDGDVLGLFCIADLDNGTATVQVDGTDVTPIGMELTSGDVFLIKIDVSGLSAGSHSVTVTADGFPEGTATFYINK